ncbi:MAG: hypothetical protein AAGB26_11130 [Planctomycetota bacterium]
MDDSIDINTMQVASCFRVASRSSRSSTLVGPVMATPNVLFMILMRAQFEHALVGFGLALATPSLLMPFVIDAVNESIATRKSKNISSTAIICQCKDLPIALRRSRNGWPKGTHNKKVICIVKEAVDKRYYSPIRGLRIDVGSHSYKFRPPLVGRGPVVSQLREWGWLRQAIS